MCWRLRTFDLLARKAGSPFGRAGSSLSKMGHSGEAGGLGWILPVVVEVDAGGVEATHVIAVFEEGLVVVDWWEAFEGSEGLDGF